MNGNRSALTRESHDVADNRPDAGGRCTDCDDAEGACPHCMAYLCEACFREHDCGAPYAPLTEAEALPW